MKKTVIVITGPTGSGKSGLALSLATKLNGSVINADSMQVYDLYPRLTAQPTDEEKKRAPHLLYSTVRPSVKSTADSWAKDAQAAIRNVFREGRTPILAGGSGLYLEFLMHGRSAIPEVSEEHVAQARAEYEKLGPAGAYEKLREVDPETASRLKPGDKARVIRAYEVYLSSGHGIAYWQKEKFEPPKHEWNYKTIFLMPSREKLYKNIDARFEKMVEAGALDEVRAAMKRNIPADHPAHKAHGARELQDVIEKRWKLEDAIARSQQVTRNYAKRQFTWFNNRFMAKEKEAERDFLSLESHVQAKNLAEALDFTMKA